MDTLLLMKAALMGVVEGLTEFLPISSTGHLILVGSLLNFHDEKAKVFDIAIQSGAILAVIVYYWQRIWGTVAGIASVQQSQRFALNVVIGFLPAGLIGYFAYSLVSKALFNAYVVATTFILGGLIILWVERRQARNPSVVRVHSIDEMTQLDALKVGLVQCFAMFPGTSRSGATIIGGMLLGLSRTAATEFSFFLAIPTLVGATVLALYKQSALLRFTDLPIFSVGFLFAFASALFVVHWLIRYVSTHTFVVFAWYRIIFGLIVLLTAWSGLVEWKS